MGLRFTLSGQDCFGTTEGGWTEMPSHPARALLVVSGSSSSTPRSRQCFHSEQRISPQKSSPSSASRYRDSLDAISADGWHSRFFYFILFFKWSGTQMVLFLLSQSLTEMWTQTCLNWEAQPGSMFLKSCRNYCTDQFSLNQSHTWQRFPCPAFIWMGGFVPLVPTSPHLMPVTNTFPEVQQAAPQKLRATVSNTHATLGEILTVSFKKYCICSLPPPHTRCCLRAHKTSQILRFSQPPPTPVAPSPPGHRGGGTWPITSHWAVASSGKYWKRPTALIPAGATNWRKSDTLWLQFIDNKPLTVLN